MIIIAITITIKEKYKFFWYLLTFRLKSTFQSQPKITIQQTNNTYNQ